jgi:hypothetical protein
MAYGFAPISTLTGAPWNGQARSYPISPATTNAYPLNAGDPVIQVADGGISAASAALAPNAPYNVIGVFIGCSYKLVGQLEFINSSYFPGPGSPYDPAYPPMANVIDDPNVLYSIQVNGNSGLLAADVGQNSLWIQPGSPSTSGQSGFLLNYASNAPTSTLPLKIIGLAPDSINITDASGLTAVLPNQFGVVNNHALVLFNVHLYKGVGTLGV